MNWFSKRQNAELEADLAGLSWFLNFYVLLTPASSLVQVKFFQQFSKSIESS